jgi:hypothetical protein
LGPRRLAEFAARHLLVLLCYRGLHLRRGRPKLGERVRVEPASHGIAFFAEDRDVTDAF